LRADIGDIPDTIRLCGNLQHVDLSSNQLQRYIQFFVGNVFRKFLKTFSVETTVQTRGDHMSQKENKMQFTKYRKKNLGYS